MSGTDPGRPLKTLETALEVVDVLRESGGTTMGALAAELGCARSTVHGYVRTLERADYLVEEDGRFYLGMAFLEAGGHVRRRKPAFRAAVPGVEELASETGERAQFVVEEHGRGTYIHVATGDDAVAGDAHIGKRVHLHASAAGKAILAHLPSDRVDEIVDRHGLPEFTDSTVTDRSRLAEALEADRERGYAVNDQEEVPGLRAVGAPLIVDDRVVGGIEIAGPAHRVRDGRFHDEFVDLVLGVTNELRLRLEYE